MKKITSFIFFVFCAFVAGAQPNGSTPMADAMRSNGKIFVVVAVILTIFAGIILYLVRLDKKISKLEKNQTRHT